MSTNSTIRLDIDGVIGIIYVHWDGHPDTAGKTLVENYNTVEEIKELIGMGDISELAGTIEDSVFYTRDRGEDGQQADRIPTPLFELKDFTQKYNYVFENGEWYVYDEQKDITSLVKDVM